MEERPAIDVEEEYAEGLHEESIYEEEARESMVDSDALTPAEAAFMKGYDDSYV